MLAHTEMLFYDEESQFHLRRMSGEKLPGCRRCLHRVTSHAPPLPCPTAADVEWQGWPTMSTWAKRTFPSLFHFIFQSLTNIRLASISLSSWGWLWTFDSFASSWVKGLQACTTTLSLAGKIPCIAAMSSIPRIQVWGGGVMPAISAFGRQRQLEFPRQPTKTTRWVTGH